MTTFKKLIMAAPKHYIDCAILEE